MALPAQRPNWLHWLLAGGRFLALFLLVVGIWVWVAPGYSRLVAALARLFLPEGGGPDTVLKVEGVNLVASWGWGQGSSMTLLGYYFQSGTILLLALLLLTANFSPWDVKRRIRWFGVHAGWTLMLMIVYHVFYVLMMIEIEQIREGFLPVESRLLPFYRWLSALLPSGNQWVPIAFWLLISLRTSSGKSLLPR